MSLLLKSDTIYVAGHRGLAGAATFRLLQREGYENLVGFSSSELDLTNRDAVFDMFMHIRPKVVVDAAALVGGIQANLAAPVDFLHRNLQIQINLMDAAFEAKVPRFLFLGSSCAYPKFAAQPFKEDSLMTGALEESNRSYALAKIAGVVAIQSFRSQHGLNWVSALPTNLYGPGDNFDPDQGHVLAALMRRFHEAKVEGAPAVTVWGSGAPLREFLHADDLASAILTILKAYDDAQPINVGSGREISIENLSGLIASKVGYAGEINFDTTLPDGMARKMLSNEKLSSLGWEPQWSLEDGVAEVYTSYLERIG